MNITGGFQDNSYLPSCGNVGGRERELCTRDIKAQFGTPLIVKIVIAKHVLGQIMFCNNDWVWHSIICKHTTTIITKHVLQ